MEFAAQPRLLPDRRLRRHALVPADLVKEAEVWAKEDIAAAAADDDDEDMEG